jgi:hypothetical protein
MVASTDQPYNPAMIAADRTHATFRHGWTDADAASFSIRMLEAAQPLSRRDSVKIVYTDLSSGPEPMPAAPVPGATIDFSGRHLSVLYGRQINDRLSVGIGMAPLLDCKVTLGSPLGALAQVKGRVEYDGARIGLQYLVSNEVRTAVQFDSYTVSSTMTDFVGARRIHQDFRTNDLVAGLEYTPNADWSFVAEFEAGEFSGGAFSQSMDSLRFGAEYRANEDWAVRAGLADGQPTAGLQWRHSDLTVGFAWMQDQYDEQLGSVLGGSDTFYCSAGWTF